MIIFTILGFLFAILSVVCAYRTDHKDKSVMLQRLILTALSGLIAVLCAAMLLLA